ncbi:helix-turn-helix domain-containing protein [Okeanomitos corallinicola TIOX110]|uniref:Helix-turn-helix domain-containing protein n=1 Tax=Okeanomitos corallinicola TIOX110 TaxID=3133117 RepID=A0ABZ2UUM5_9CYAN
MSIEILFQKSEILHKYLSDLYQTAHILPWIPDNLVPQAFKELYTTSQLLQIAAEEIYQQNEELIKTRNLLEIEYQKYQNLFEFAPIAYILTNQQGIIKTANQTTSQLLNIPINFLVGKPIINFIPQEQHHNFYSQLVEISKSAEIKEILLPIQPRYDHCFDACLKVKSVINNQDRYQTLYWLIQRIYPHQSVEMKPIQNLTDLENNFSIHKYTKGENIPLHPQSIWYVKQGLVKLNTFSETGQEIITRLATTEMIFGSMMTSLQLYQATALVDVELVSIHIKQLNIFPSLKEMILDKIEQGLQQAEYFLFIAGQRKLETRLIYLLELLKQLIGEPVAAGTRLTFHLTHEDIANICGTSRVTITRLIGKLQQQGVICIDHKKHIIYKHKK